MNGVSRWVGVLAVVASFALAACPQPNPMNGALTCSASGACPKGYSCSGGFCFNDRADLSGGAADLSAHDHAPAVDLAGVDLASRGAQCEEYCTCMQMNCVGNNPTFTTAAQCLDYCTALPAGAQMDCRIVHCGLAKSESNAPLHCPHALGIGNCQDP